MHEGRRERPAKIGDRTLKARVALGGDEIRQAERTHDARERAPQSLSLE